jgi:hypothetical protein
MIIIPKSRSNGSRLWLLLGRMELCVAYLTQHYGVFRNQKCRRDGASGLLLARRARSSKLNKLTECLILTLCTKFQKVDRMIH